MSSATGGSSRYINSLLAKPLAAPAAAKRLHLAPARAAQQAPSAEADPDCLYEVLMAVHRPASDSATGNQAAASDSSSLTLACQRSPAASAVGLIGMESQLAVAQQAANAAFGIAEINLATSGGHAAWVSEPCGQGSSEGSAAWSLLRTLQQETDVRCSGGDSAPADSKAPAHLQITLTSDTNTAAGAVNNGDARTTRHAGE